MANCTLISTSSMTLTMKFQFGTILITMPVKYRESQEKNTSLKTDKNMSIQFHQYNLIVAQNRQLEPFSNDVDSIYYKGYLAYQIDLFANLQHQYNSTILLNHRHRYYNIKIIQSDMDQDIIIKFCIVGEPAVGKTSMLCQYIHKKFDEKVRPTIGCDFSTKLKSTIDGKPVRLQLWDIAGQERFNAVSKMYLRGALGCVIVCSSTQRSTLDETLKWKKIIQDNSDYDNDTNIPCLLVQNKCDMISPDVPQEFQKKSFLDDFAKTHGFCGFVHTSAKDNKNIEQVFQMLLDETIKRELVKGKIPALNNNNSANKNSEPKLQNNPIKLTNNNAGNNAETKQKKKCC